MSGRAQFGHRKRQPLDAFATEIDLDPGIRPRSLGIDNDAGAELGMAHLLADAETSVVGRSRLAPAAEGAGIRI